jgi:hypothetical protein
MPAAHQCWSSLMARMKDMRDALILPHVIRQAGTMLEDDMTFSRQKLYLLPHLLVYLYLLFVTM